MIPEDQIQVRGEMMDRLNGVYGVIGKKLHILGYVEKEVGLVHPLEKYEKDHHQREGAKTVQVEARGCFVWSRDRLPG
eukprot:snap_masked-scaffold_29-processed-gene-0.15-mRNA-1 protein AED:1.00 eAED:1.00 QI:0/0/0/0/1/1/2/0/77